MHVVEVIPVARGAASGTLTYFSSAPHSPGSVVSITLRKRSAVGVVAQSAPLAERKSELRQAEFALKKLRAPGKAVFPALFLEAVAATARLFVAPLGAVFFALAPLPLLRRMKSLPEALPSAAGRGFEQLVIQAPLEERLAEYRSLIREAFARRESVLILTPTIAQALALEEELSRGVAAYVVALHSDLAEKEALAQWRRAARSEHPLLIIATPGFLSVPRHDLSLIIVEREGARSYKRFERPYLDVRVAARELARARRIRILMGDLPLRIETLFLLKQHDAAEITPVRSRLSFPTPARLIDMRPYRKEGKGFRVLSDELCAALEKTAQGRGHAFVYGSRRGAHPTVLCDDCSTPVVCDTCGKSVVLHKTPRGNAFLCHMCGARRSASEKCRTCGSWKLSSLGIGSALIEESVRKLFPRIPIFRIDQDSARDHKRAAVVSRAFFEAPAAILVGTERAVSYLTSPVDLVGVASLDSLFSLPDYSADERVFSLLTRLRTLAGEHMLVQTREPGRPVFGHALSGTLMEFYRDELALRERFSYPPFSTLIRVSIQGTRPRVEKEVKALEQILKPWEPSLFPGMLKCAGGVSAHFLIKAKKWPDETLGERLRALPPSVAVEIGAGSVLPS